MVLTTTAIGFCILALGLTFCGIHFFRAFQKIGGARAGKKIGVLLSSMFLNNAIAVGVLGGGALFFGNNSEILYRFLVMSHIPLMVTATLGIYLIFYIFFPLISPWPATISVFILGSILVVATIADHPHPFIDGGSGLDLNLSHEVSILLAYVLFIAIGSSFTIFAQAFMQAKSRDVRIVSLVLAILAIAGITNTFTRYLIQGDIVHDPLRIRVYDMIHVFIGITFVVIFVIIPVIFRRKSEVQDHQ